MGGYDLFMEDFAPGDRFVTEGETVTESQVIDFAMQWDPQPYHTNARHPRTVAQGGLMASGFHTVCMTFRQFQMDGVIGAAALASPGIDKLRWLKPVRPGDTLHVESEVVSVRRFESKPDRGAVTMEHRTVNQDGAAVFSCECTHILQCRDGGGERSETREV